MWSWHGTVLLWIILFHFVIVIWYWSFPQHLHSTLQEILSDTWEDPTIGKPGGAPKKCFLGKIFPKGWVAGWIPNQVKITWCLTIFSWGRGLSIISPIIEICDSWPWGVMEHRQRYIVFSCIVQCWFSDKTSIKWSHTRRGGPPAAHWRPPLTHPPWRVRLHARCAEPNVPAGINQAQQAAASAVQNCC